MNHPGERKGEEVGAAVQAEPESCELQIQGMTCAACVRRVERALTSVPGVRAAHVNLVTERALVQLDAGMADRAALSRAVAAAGYEVVPPRAADLGAQGRGDELARREQAEDQSLRRDLWLAALLTVPLLVLGMSHGALPEAEGPAGQMTQLLLATAIVLGPGWRFVR